MRINPINAVRYVVLTVALAGVAAAWYYDLQSHLTLAAAEQYKQDLGAWAPVVFILVFIVGELLQVPSVIWIVLAGMMWPWWIALPLALAAALLAAMAAFLAARFILGERISDKLPNSFRNVDAWLASRPIRAIVVIRLSTFLHPVVHWVLAASSARLPAFLIGTAIGIAPATIALVLLGEVFATWWDDHAIIVVVLAIAAVAVYMWLRRRANKASEV